MFTISCFPSITIDVIVLYGKKNWEKHQKILPFYSEPILHIRKIHKLRRAPETPGGPLALKDLILVSLLNLASGYENRNVNFF